MNKELTLRRIKNTDFFNLYKDFIIGNSLSDLQYESLLAIAVCFINSEDKYVNKLGYRIIVEYCNQKSDYVPLYDIAINNGLYPISKFIDDHYVSEDEKNFFTEWNDAFMERYHVDDLYQSEQQYRLNEFFKTEKDKTVSIIAPTSYGKSELILSSVDEYIDRRICILTSTKALLMQTKNRIMRHLGNNRRKIIVHPEMYNEKDEACLAVLTQERLLRLLKKDPNLCFDCLIVDEAHELLTDDNRSRLLANVIIVIKKRNPDSVIKFLTPFLSDSENLKTRYSDYDVKPFSVDEYVKSEKYYLLDLREKHKATFYDQFMNEFIELPDNNCYESEEIFIKNNHLEKNIIYLNKPIDVESFALKLASVLPAVNSNFLDDACKSISEYISEGYNLVKCLRKGVIYHHGSIPDSVRAYIEDLYRNLDCIKFVVTSSTLLAGVNLPANRMFILSNKKGRRVLSYSQFRNLVGRVCRFSTIFNSKIGSLKYLEPEIFILFGSYFDKGANCKNFLRNVAKIDKSINDDVENVLLEKSKVDIDDVELDKASEFLENFENGVIESYHSRLVKTIIGRSCIMNGITEFDIFQHEQNMQDIVDSNYSYVKIKDEDALMHAMDDIFFRFFDRISGKDDNECLYRLRDEAAINFYATLFKLKSTNASYPVMVKSLMNYWDRLGDRLVFVGRWGNEKKNVHSIHKNYRMMCKCSNSTKLNLAIVRVKEELDLIDNILIKFVEVMNDINLLEPDFYNKVKYGSSNNYVICLMKNGLSLSTSSLLVKKYFKYLLFDLNDSKVRYQSRLIDFMQAQKENDVMVCEVINYL